MRWTIIQVCYLPRTSWWLLCIVLLWLSWFFWKDKLDSRSPNWWHSRVMTDTFINWIQAKPFSFKVAVQLTSWKMFKTSMLDLVYAMSITIRFVTLETFQTLWFFCGPMHIVEDMAQVLDKLTYLVHIGWALICNGKESQVLFMTWR